MSRAVVGAAVFTVLVAWGIRLDAGRPIWSDVIVPPAIDQREIFGMPVDRSRLADSGIWYILHEKQPNCWAVSVGANQPGLVLFSTFPTEDTTENWIVKGSLRTVEKPPAWSRASKLPTDLQIKYPVQCNEIVAGWPFLSLYERNFVGDPPVIVQDGRKPSTSELRSVSLEVSKSSMIRYWFRRSTTRLPIIPIWPGFVFNVLFYASLWLGVSFVVRSVWERRRVGKCHKRGVCPTRGCGYEMEELGLCPECGAEQVKSAISGEKQPQITEGN